VKNYSTHARDLQATQGIDKGSKTKPIAGLLVTPSTHLAALQAGPLAAAQAPGHNSLGKAPPPPVRATNATSRTFHCDYNAARVACPHSASIQVQ